MNGPVVCDFIVIGLAGLVKLLHRCLWRRKHQDRCEMLEGVLGSDFSAVR